MYFLEDELIRMQEELLEMNYKDEMLCQKPMIEQRYGCKGLLAGDNTPQIAITSECIQTYS